MAFNRRRESMVRLEALGHRPDYFGDVASVSNHSDAEGSAIDINDRRNWEVDSSNGSTVAIVYDKKPPPGLLATRALKQRRDREMDVPSTAFGVDETVSSHGEHVEPKSDHRVKKLRRPRDEATLAQLEAGSPAQLRPATGLSGSRHPASMKPGSGRPTQNGDKQGGEPSRQTQHPAMLRPGPAAPPQGRSEYGDDSSKRQRHPSVMRPGSAAGEPLAKRTSYGGFKPQKPVYREPSQQSSSERPVSTHTAYQPPAPEPSQSRQSSTKQQNLNLYGAPMRDDGGSDDDLRSNYTSATYSFTPNDSKPLARSGVQSSRISQRSNRQTPHSAAASPYGVGIELVSSTQAMTPVRGRGRGSIPSRGSSTSQAPPTPARRDASPSRGAWTSDHPRQKRGSFVDRAQQHIQRSIREHLVKAGLRPLPSFEVKSVCKSPVVDYAPEYSWQRPARDIPAVTPYRPARGIEWPGQSTTKTYKSPVKKTSDELFLGSPSEPRASGLFEPKWTGPHRRQGAPELRVDTNIPTCAELETPMHSAGIPAHSDAPVELETDLEPFPAFSQTEADAVADLPDDFGGVGVQRNDSLHLGPGAIRDPAGYSFYAPEWSQRRVLAEVERNARAQPEPLDDRRCLPSGTRRLSRDESEREVRYSQHQQYQAQQSQYRLPAPVPAPGSVAQGRGLSRKKGTGQLR
ncbi:Uu.00g042450.m01.CDS01 [Anthostomella pinea]|uniref:Uu.00g042450.m01.CDS01 n=1 Tax=Anthostomella pinea TaxID=933095 RepID=A0AAI8YE51_9PEZI|nr:Uu.00g042450.m01.CDS01 [Anthostomella pinea]